MPEKIESIKAKPELEKPPISLKPEDMGGKFDVEEKKKREAIQEKAKNELVENLSRGYIYYDEESLEGVDYVRTDKYGNDTSGEYDPDGNDWDWKHPQFEIPADVISSSEVQQAAREGVAYCLKNSNVERAIEIKDTFSLPAEAAYPPEQREAIDGAIIERASEGNSDGS